MKRLRYVSSALILMGITQMASASGTISLGATYSDRKDEPYPTLGFSVWERFAPKYFATAYVGHSYNSGDAWNSKLLRFYFGNLGVGYEATKRCTIQLTTGFNHNYDDEITEGWVRLNLNYKVWK